MMKVVKGGICITVIYVLAVLCTLLVCNRVQELDSRSDFRNINSSLSIGKKSKSWFLHQLSIDNYIDKYL